MTGRSRGALLLTLTLLACGRDAGETAGSGSSAGAGGAGPGGGAGPAGMSGTSGYAGAGGAAGPAGAGGGGCGGIPGFPGCCDESCGPWMFWDPEAGQPPAPPADAPASPGDPDLVHAASAFFVGDTDRDDVGSPAAWQAYGYNLDGWVSTSKQGYHCRAREGGKLLDICDDGPEGADNSFGRNVVPVLRELLAYPSQVATKAAREGRDGWLLSVTSLGSATTATGLSGSLWRAEGTREGGALVAPPADDWSAYAWHPLAGTEAPFAKAYVTGGVLVARFDQPIVVSLPLSPAGLPLPVRRAVLTVDVNTPGQGLAGTLAGILPTDEVVAAVIARLPDIDPAVCHAEVAAAVAEYLSAASDILVDGTQDPERECDGISIGLGFTTRAARRGDVVTAPTVADACAPPTLP